MLILHTIYFWFERACWKTFPSLAVYAEQFIIYFLIFDWLACWKTCLIVYAEQFMTLEILLNFFLLGKL